MMAHHVLVQLGQSIPTSFDKKDIKVIVNTTSNLICGESLLEMKEMETKEQFILQFYEKISTVAFLAKPRMVPFFICRMIQISMTHGICKFSSLGFVQYAAMLCVDNTVIDIEEACKIGKLAISLLKRFDSATDQISKILYTYYGMVSMYTEPVQSCVNNLRRGFECGIASGDTSSAFINALYEIGKALIAGTHLPTLLKRTNYYMEVMKVHTNTLAETTLLLLRDTIQILMMGREGNNSHKARILPDSSPGMAECAYYHRAIRAFWIGHSESSHHFIEKVLGGTISGGRNFRSQVMLYYGLNCFKITRRTGSFKLKGVPRNALRTLKTAAAYSSWNFGNKVGSFFFSLFVYFVCCDTGVCVSVLRMPRARLRGPSGTLRARTAAIGTPQPNSCVCCDTGVCIHLRVCVYHPGSSSGSRNILSGRKTRRSQSIVCLCHNSCTMFQFCSRTRTCMRASRILLQKKERKRECQ